MTQRMTLPPITVHDAAPAHTLRVELTTRITTQRLHYRSGDEETAVKSVYDLFVTTRKLLTDHPQAQAFNTAGNFLLNNLLRPYTARWHRWMVDKRFSDEGARRRFRVELKQLQKRLAHFVRLLEHLAAGPQDQEKAEEEFAELVKLTPQPDRSAQLGPPVEAGIGTEVPFAKDPDDPKKFATAAELNEAEWRFIHQRREVFGWETPPADPTVPPAPVLDATGLCLSGGGIRSATFCLGIVQVLARQGMLPHIDYLSTVSGGGYLGSFLTAFLGTREDPSSKAPFNKQEIETAFGRAFHPVDGHESAAVRHLRNNSRYLLNGGVWGRLRAIGLVVSGIVTNILLVLPVPLLAVLAVFGLVQLDYWGPAWPQGMAGARGWPAFRALLGCAAVLGIAWLALPFVQNSTRGAPPKSFPSKLRTFWESLNLLLALLALLLAFLLLLPGLFAAVDAVRNTVASWVDRVDVGKVVSMIGAVAPFLFGLLAARLRPGRGKKVAEVLFSLSGPFFLFLVFLFAGRRVLDGTWEWSSLAIAAGLLTVWGWGLVDINTFSPHGFYRNRLCECYLAVPRDEDEAGFLRGLLQRKIHGRKAEEAARKTHVGTLRQLPLSTINATGAAPYHLINTAANLPASREPNLRGRDCDFYVFSRHYCGGPVCGYVTTETIEKLDPHVDLGTAMAVSGAAASTNMGVKTLRQYRWLIAMLNVRLGYWLRNPKRGKRWFWNVPGPSYLFYEMTGWMHENRRYLNLSDGGHIENLALYELLRRRCKLIIAVDGGMEPGMECADLMMAQRYAEIDLSVRLELDVADLALDASRRSRAYAIFGKIHYGPNDLGWLLYLKLAMTGEEPGYVVDYRRQNPEFPHQTTGDQIYDEAQFEAYRRLGEGAAESLFRKELTADRPDRRVGTLHDWFQALADNLLPDNDPAFDGPPGR